MHNALGVYGGCISELTMARLNEINMLCHFTHCGVDMIPDNTCHYGMNIFFADNGLLGQHPTPLYFPADPLQMEAVVKRVFHDHGIRFVFCTRPAVAYIRTDRNLERLIPNTVPQQPRREGGRFYIFSNPEMSCSERA